MSDIYHPLSIPDMLKKWAEDTPDNPAILAPAREPLTYRMLFSHVSATVAKLNSFGIRQNDRVATVLPNGPEMATAFLSVASAATSAPLNPAYQESDFEFYLSDLKAKALLISAGVDSSARNAAHSLQIPVIELTVDMDEPAGLFNLPGLAASPTSREVFTEPDDVALVLHTSGTTSRPKIVPLTHTNICTNAQYVCKTLALSPNDRCLNVMPLFHGHGLMDATLSSLTVGAGLICTPGFDANHFFEWFDKFQPTWYTAIPTIHQAVLSIADDHQDAIDRAKTRLRFVRAASASLPPVVMTELEKLFDVPVIDSYGLSEVSHITSNPLPPRQRKLGSIGEAAGPEAAIMDGAGNLLPPNTIGEIVTRGANVMLGYADNPEANAAAFYDGWFRTGDQGWLDDDGYFFLSGRLKEIINRGGENIAPREIDEALLEHPHVKQAVAFSVPHRTLGEDVAAAVILESNGTTVTEADLRDYAFEKLADFKVPSQIIIVDEIPMGATGKLQRIGLAEKLSSKLQTEYVAPRNGLEQNLATIWAEVLGHDQIGVHDNFFGVGGDSIAAARLLNGIEEYLGERIPLVMVFRAPTIAQFAKLLDKKEPAAPATSLAVEQPPNPNSILPNALVGLKNRLCQLLALYAPGLATTRVFLHRLRGVHIGKNVTIGTSAIIETGHPKLVSIGDNASIGIRTIIVAHYHGSSTIRNSYDEFSVRIEEDVYIGAGAIILPHVVIGKGSVIAAGSVVNRSIPPGVMAQGNPAVPVARCGIPYTDSYEEFLRHLTPIDPTQTNDLLETPSIFP